MNIPLSKPYITEKDIEAVVEVLKSGHLSLGPKLKEFEEQFAKYIGVKHAIAVNSGTSGLHLAIKALDIKDGDEVITTPFSFIASANCILFERAKPVFVDINENDFNIDVTKIEAAITKKTKAILPVHVFGQTCDMDAITKIAKKHNLKIIEDSCEAIGAKYKEKMAGSFGDVSVFAFYPNKQMTTGEGGMVLTNDDDVAALCKSYRNQGRDTMAWLDHSRIGYNYRLSDINCTLGIEQIKKIDKILSMRKNVASMYEKKLKNVKEVILPKISKFNEESWFVYVIRVQEGIDRNKVMDMLKQRGIACNSYFPPIHLQSFYVNEFGYKKGMFPITEKVGSSTIALPFFSELSENQIDYVCDNLKEILKELK